jgi:hypothetical protein
MKKSKRVKKSKAVDVKKAAAHDVEVKPEAGAARAAGLRLYILAGKPKKGDFVRVFGQKGPAWTWEARAKAVGLTSAEECATSFQSLLKRAGR